VPCFGKKRIEACLLPLQFIHLGHYTPPYGHVALYVSLELDPIPSQSGLILQILRRTVHFKTNLIFSSHVRIRIHMRSAPMWKPQALLIWKTYIGVATNKHV
jgi:hypothetical protein